MSTTTAANTFTYSLDPAHTAAKFWVRHMMVSKVHGSFSTVKGTVTLNPTNMEEAQIDVSVETASLSTGVEQRDAHLKSPDFFDVEKFPTILFKSSEIHNIGDSEYKVIGDLTMHGVTRKVTLVAEVSPEVPNPYGGFKIGVSATGTLDREEFGMTWNQAIEAGGVLVGKEVHLQIDAELDRPAN